MAYPEFPTIDAHAHISTDVTPAQVRKLGTAIVVGVTRTLDEAASVPHGCYETMIWGLGVHPGVREAISDYDPNRFLELLSRFAVVGEVGLDRRAARFESQREVFADILARVGSKPVWVTVHSSGAPSEVLEELTKHPVRAPVLHWFGGSKKLVAQACEIGSWFSVNGAMAHDALAALPRDRVVTETDFPYTRRQGARRPGDTATLEAALSHVWKCPVSEVRAQVWENFGALVAVSGATEKLPRTVRERLLWTR